MFLNEVSSRFGLNGMMSLAENLIGRALNGLADLFGVQNMSSPWLSQMLF